MHHGCVHYDEVLQTSATALEGIGRALQRSGGILCRCAEDAPELDACANTGFARRNTVG